MGLLVFPNIFCNGELPIASVRDVGKRRQRSATSILVYSRERDLASRHDGIKLRYQRILSGAVLNSGCGIVLYTTVQYCSEVLLLPYRYRVEDVSTHPCRQAQYRYNFYTHARVLASPDPSDGISSPFEKDPSLIQIDKRKKLGRLEGSECSLLLQYYSTTSLQYPVQYDSFAS